MSFDWEAYKKLAEQLVLFTETPSLNLGDLDKEAALRSAISRAYYCIYHTTTIYLKDYTEYDPKKYEAYQQLIDAYSNSIYRERRALAAKIDRLRRRRVRADYWQDFEEKTRGKPDFGLNITAVAKQTLNEAGNIITAIQQLQIRPGKLI